MSNHILSLMSACGSLGICLYSPLVVSRSHLQSGICLWKAESMERQVFLGLKTCWVLACTLIVSTLDTNDNSIPATPTDHSSWASIQASLPTACILSIPGNLCELTSVSLLASSLGSLFLFLLK